MQASRLVLTFLLALIGCEDQLVPISDGGSPGDAKNCSAMPDMTIPTAPCLAAKGLSGDNLLCIDFSQVKSLSDPKLARWDFSNPVSCPGWEILNDKLQVKNFSTFMMSSCSFTMPAINLNDVDKQKYKSVTLSVVQRVDMADQQQIAQIFLGTDLPARQMWYGTGRNPRQTSTLNIATADLPTGLNGVYQFLFKLNATQPGSPVQNWFIESIAVNLVP